MRRPEPRRERSHALRWLATVPALALSLAALFALPASASAQGGYGWGVGPSFALGDEGSLSLGWEAGVTGGLTVLKLNAGGSYRLSGGGEEPRALHYLAFEPWLIVGGTLGMALADAEPHLLAGVWEGFPIPLEGELFGGDNSDDVHPKAWLLTIAIGIHFFGGRQQFYLTPKLSRYATIEFNS